MDKLITSDQLVNYTSTMIERAAVYWYSCYGQIASAQVYNDILSRYPEKVGKWPKSTYIEQYGKRAFDCSGLIKSAAGSRGDPDYICKYKDISLFDWSANTMIANCTEVVDFEDIPEIPGLCVWKSGHVGVFIKTLPDGRKLVHEAAGHMRGVIATTDTKWKRAGKLPFVDYTSKPGPSPEPTPGGDIDVNVKTLKYTSGKAMQDPNVLVFQSMMNTLGIKDDDGRALTEDSKFGPRCVQAAKRFQRSKGLTADGIVGAKTWDRIVNG